MDHRAEVLEAAGWIPVNSVVWKAPGEDSPTARKWILGDAYREQQRRKAAEPPAPPKPKKSSSKKKAAPSDDS